MKATDSAAGRGEAGAGSDAGARADADARVRAAEAGAEAGAESRARTRTEARTEARARMWSGAGARAGAEVGAPSRTATLTNSLLAILCTALLAFVTDRLARESRAWALELATGVVVCVAALARRRHPVAAPIVALAVSGIAAVIAMVAGLPSEPGPVAILGLMLIAGSAVRMLPAVPAAAIALCGTVVAGSGRLGAMAGYQTSHAAYFFATQGWLVAVALGLRLRYLDRRRRGMAEAVRREERLAMARELHDVVAHHITGIVVQTQAARITARRRADSADPEGLDANLAEIEAAGGEALTAMRRVVGLLRDADDAVTTGAGVGRDPGELAELVRRFAGHGPAVTLSLPEREQLRWPPEIAATVYRVVQESLTNIARHAAHARSASVRITRAPEGGIRIEVTDDAPAGAPRHLHRGGFGLIGMRERVEALGGTLDAGPRPAPAGGWAVTATVPVPPVSDSAPGSDSVTAPTPGPTPTPASRA